MRPYYEHGGITIYHADCREVIPQLGPVDLVLTDPPFGKETHEGARTGSQTRVLVDFDSITAAQLVEYFRLFRTVCAKWQVAFIEWRHMLPLDQADMDLELIRFGVWVKPNGMPQYSGDRPATGWEAIAFLHPPGQKKWNGGGRSSVFTCNFEQNNRPHPTQKPLELVGKLVNLFSNPGDLILDPFMGSGTTLEAAKLHGRRAIGIELEERWCEAAAMRLAQEVFAF